MFPADHALVQHERLPGRAVPHPLLLEQDEGGLPAPGLPWELKTRSILRRGNHTVLTKSNQQGMSGVHLDGKQVAPVGLGGLGVHQPVLEDKVDLLASLLAPPQALQHHLPHAPRGRAEQVDGVLTPPVTRWVDHRDPSPELGRARVPGRLLVHAVQALLDQLPALLERVPVSVAGGGDLEKSGEEERVASHSLDGNLHNTRVNSAGSLSACSAEIIQSARCVCLWPPVCGFSCEIGLFPLLAGIRVARDKVGRWDTIGSVKQCQVATAC